MIDEGSLILTPTARLARSVLRQVAATNIEHNRVSWRQPEVLSFPAWLSRLREQWFLDGDDDCIPVSASQALVLWRSVIDKDIFIGEPRVAELAQAAWRLIHEHRLPHPGDWESIWLSEDQRRFRDWVGRFESLCRERGLVDDWSLAARLPELIREGRLDVPKQLLLRGFDLPMNALQAAIIKAAEAAGSEVGKDEADDRPAARPELLEFDLPDAELCAAARWARKQLEHDPDARIGIVVPDLRQRLLQVERQFQRVFDPPGFALHAASSRAWHVSLGHALSDWPLVDDALSLLALKPWRISQPEAGRLLRSPFLDGWNREARARDAVRALLAQRSPYAITAGELMHQASKGQAVVLGRKLVDWQNQRRAQPDRAWPSNWARHFQLELSALGFGHGRALNSREYQTLQRWHDLLEEFSALDLVHEQPLTRAQARQALADRAGSVVFRERNPGAAIEVLGVEEALGERFDAVWISTLDSEHWPGRVRRDPLIPARLQAGLPGGSSEASLIRARQELDGLCRTAPEVMGSHARGEADEPLQRTALIDGTAGEMIDVSDPVEPVALEQIEDDSQAPPLEQDQSGGGTALLQHQSDCPFKGFAVWRLGAEDTRPPRPGLDARARGSLLHNALERFWKDIPDQATLLALNPKSLETRIDQAAEAAMDDWQQRDRLTLGQRGRKLELDCLKRALTRWLELEKTRGPFSIKRLEAPIDMQFGRLHLSGKIDRIDEIEGGGELLIDYKTGNAARNGWAPDARLADVQMPAYAISLRPRPVALAFARLKPESMAFEGLAEVNPEVHGIDVIGQITRKPFKETESWQDLLRDWEAELEALAAEFVEGRAAVDPRHHDVCKYCHLQPMCRIHERKDRLTGEDDE
ncbi:PD-(D/E)XK nuclease family protein [Wenzhouxiangella sp. AB-CW3]|uniref:PD-(D/E)XK nuclease family protein n=1 Tax=Wenzhouxiangella sp. AB-CW3 TaxID=2771012 RepID=UPI00168B51A3|nr:PD-(D/E)XK nuclease family protein [Wenzhouxiangella sp. AB-CW3]QOC22073.1 PD-(D/E)XK nuclease family protein [Wenzhouxiangella sp. AB-CW3]